MRLRPRDRLLYVVERLMLRGAQWRLLVIAAAVAVIAIVGAALVVAGGEDFDSLGAAVWWAFLRLTDPGYLGDDVGTWRRIVATVLTITGYVVFLGALIAVMTQWLNAFMRHLELGLTPIIKQDHVVILGWTDRTPTLVRELLMSGGRVRRFLRRHDARKLDIVILAEEVGPHYVQELRDRLGEYYDNRRIVLRSGTPLRQAHLERVAFLQASVILLPGSDFPWEIDREAHEAGLTISDTMAIKVLLSIASSARDAREELPQVVAEMTDARKVPVAENAYAGPVEVVASDLIVSRLIAQNLRNPGLSHVATELLSHSHGNQIFVRELRDSEGSGLAEVRARFPRALVIGIARPEGQHFQSLLGLRSTVRLERGDRVVLVAHGYADTEPVDAGKASTAAATSTPSAPASPAGKRRVLVLGWSYRLPSLFAELAAYEREQFAIDILSALPAAERARLLARDPNAPKLEVRQLEGDITVPADLAAVNPQSYDNVLVLGSSWVATRDASDARTVLCCLLLPEALAIGKPPEVVIELLDEANLALLGDHPGEVLISPQIVSHMLAQVALRPELGSVFDELFGPAGAEIHFVRAADYGLTGRAITFADATAEVARRGGVALGFRFAAERRTRTGGVHLNPDRDRGWKLAADDDIVVLIDE